MSRRRGIKVSGRRCRGRAVGANGAAVGPFTTQGDRPLYSVGSATLSLGIEANVYNGEHLRLPDDPSLLGNVMRRNPGRRFAGGRRNANSSSENQNESQCTPLEKLTIPGRIFILGGLPILLLFKVD